MTWHNVECYFFIRKYYDIGSFHVSEIKVEVIFQTVLGFEDVHYRKKRVAEFCFSIGSVELIGTQII